MLFRGLGIGIVILTCSIYGFKLKNNYLKRIRHLQEFIRLLENLIGEIKYKNCDLIENFTNINRKKTYQIFMDEIINGLSKGQAIHRLWNDCCKKNLITTALNKSDIDFISNLGYELGCCDRESQINHLEYYKKSLQNIVSELKKEKNEKCRLCSSMGIVCGVFFGILFI